MTPPVLPLPPFDHNGNLSAGPLNAGGAPDGIHYTTMADIESTLVTGISGSSTRGVIWDGWMRHRAGLDRLGLSYSTLVDGSFTSRKTNPNDVDLCYLFDANELNALSGTARTEFEALTDKDACKAGYRCDVGHIPCYPATHWKFQTTVRAIAYWTHVFGSDRAGNIKCILMVGDGRSP